jgi:hypothetical protein
VDFARLCILRLRLRADTEGDASPAPSICPSYICPVCYHEKDRCSHCDTALPDPPVQP